MRKIKKYPNRKLYDTSTSGYIRLHEIVRYIKAGEEVQVIDLRTNQDITKRVMMSILREQLIESTSNLDTQTLINKVVEGSELSRDRVTTRTWLKDRRAYNFVVE